MFVSTQTSSFIDYICADLLRGYVSVYFKTGTSGAVNRYAYKNVSRRAIANLILNPNMSLGFWFNDNIENSTRVAYANWFRYDSFHFIHLLPF